MQRLPPPKRPGSHRITAKAVDHSATAATAAKMEIDGKQEAVPQAEMTSENYYFDSYSHFGRFVCVCL